MRKLFLALFCCAALASIFAGGCRKDPLDQDTDAALQFSNDTVVFDTVFTTIGSATRQFKIYNTSSKSVLISSIRLEGGSSSYFHMNVDGQPVVSTGDIVLRGGDSMFIFVDVTIDPNNSNSPLMVEDKVLFETNGNHQQVVLNAVGQDAYFHYYATLNCGEVWTNDKPHVVWGYAIVPSCCIFTIQAGTRVHLHKNSVLAVDSCATMLVQGTAANPVTFQGDRLEPDFAEEPGQWGYIWLSSLSKDNQIDWAVIKNGTVGVLCDSLGASANPTVRITNTKIRNMTLAGVYGRTSWMEGDNLLITNCAEYCVALAYGGKYKFRNCTFANYWNIDSRSTPAVLLNNWYKFDEFTNIYRDLVQADFYNCIIDGDLENELGLDSLGTTNQFNHFFGNCLIKTDINTSTPNYVGCIFSDPRFYDRAEGNFHLGSDSPAIDAGDALNSLPFDLDNVARTTVPDIGAYERP